MKACRLHRARLLVPVSSPPVENGAVLVCGGTITDAGSFKHVSRQAPPGTITMDHGDVVIIPGLVNCHCHLGLSWLQGQIPRSIGFPAWINRIMAHLFKDGKRMQADRFLESLRWGLELSKRVGVDLIGDVSNIPYPPGMKTGSRNDNPLIHLFLEKIHPFPTHVDLFTDPKDKASFPPTWSYSAHSVYTCSRQALREIKRYCRERRLPFSIHVAESLEEMEFVQSGTGPIARILSDRGRKVEEFFRPAQSPVALLKEESLLDGQTICVHCVFIGKGDLELITETGAWVCLCPKSNIYIHGSLPRADEIFDKTGKVCLGTDSLASNDNLSILSGLRVLHRNFPSIDPERLFRAATLEGARALGLGNRLGSLSPGAWASIFGVRGTPVGEKDVFEFLCSERLEEGIEKIEQ